MIDKNCPNCDYHRTVPAPSELFWIGDKPPFSNLNYCPKCGTFLETNDYTQEGKQYVDKKDTSEVKEPQIGKPEWLVRYWDNTISFSVNS